MLWHSLEAPHRGASNEHHKICFRGEIRKKYYVDTTPSSPPPPTPPPPPPSYLEIWGWAGIWDTGMFPYENMEYPDQSVYPSSLVTRLWIRAVWSALFRELESIKVDICNCKVIIISSMRSCVRACVYAISLSLNAFYGCLLNCHEIFVVWKISILDSISVDILDSFQQSSGLSHKCWRSEKI